MSSELANNALNSNAIPEAISAPVDYIFSSCRYAARGLRSVLTCRGRKRKCLIITPSFWNAADMPPFLSQITKESRIVVLFPDEPVAMLLTLRSLVHICRLSPWPLPVVVISRFQPAWLYRTLQSQVRRPEALSALQAAPSDISLRGLTSLLCSESLPSLLVRQVKDRYEKEDTLAGMTTRELEVVLGALSGQSVREQSARTGLSIKTLYTQRLSGSRKLIDQLPGLAWLLPRHPHYLTGREVTPETKPAASLHALSLSPQELEFEQAVHRGQVLPVFQPIVGPYMNVQGFEILARWFKQGQILMPAEFLPQLQATQIWVLLTAFMIREAVQQIKRFNGQYYFSVNIPACVAEDGSLLRMMKIAQNQLKEQTFSDRLVLEFAETTDFFQAPAMETIHQMVRSGHRVFLDDCFSQGSVMFPVRQVQFSGYKLDVSIVNSFLYSPHDASLVKSLVEYCRLTQTLCVAEGVDSQDKFQALTQSGVTGFQGYYISRPVLREELEITLLTLAERRTVRPSGQA